MTCSAGVSIYHIFSLLSIWKFLKNLGNKVLKNIVKQLNESIVMPKFKILLYLSWVIENYNSTRVIY